MHNFEALFSEIVVYNQMYFWALILRNRYLNFIFAIFHYKIEIISKIIDTIISYDHHVSLPIYFISIFILLQIFFKNYLFRKTQKHDIFIKSFIYKNTICIETHLSLLEII